ncbi:MAG: hypothetical protein HYY49_12005 [Ignavibacteriales bacterium]|nr:hypothetical protein [Ignavibacteriales bacterium]
MENSTSVRPFKVIDWKWVGLGYCFYVVYHLLPSYLLLGLTQFGWTDELAKGICLFAGLALIGFYIGYRSQGVTILEPAISAIVYILTLALLFDRFWGRSFSIRSAGLIYVWILGGFVIAFVSAWIGELWQARRQSAKA